MSDWWWTGWSSWAPPAFDLGAPEQPEAPMSKSAGSKSVGPFHPVESPRAGRKRKRTVTRVDKERRRAEVRDRISGLLDGLPVVYQVRGDGAYIQTAAVEFIDGTLFELTDRTHGGLSRMIGLAHRSGVCLERAWFGPGQRS